MAFFFYDFQYCYMKSFFAIIMSSFAIYATMKKIYAGKNDFCQVRIWGPAILLLFYELGQDIGNGGSVLSKDESTVVLLLYKSYV